MDLTATLNAIIKGKNESANALYRLEFGQSLHQLCHALCGNTPIHTVLPAMANWRDRDRQVAVVVMKSQYFVSVMNLSMERVCRALVFPVSLSLCDDVL